MSKVHMPKISRRAFVAATMASVGSTRFAHAQGAAADKVTLGIVNTISDAPFFIAQEKGYFRDVGLNVDIEDFPSGAKMISSLGTGQLDVSGGAVSAGLYNAAERGIPVKIVADKARNAPKYGFQSILVRQDLLDSGRFKDFKDLKGLKVAIPAIGSAGEQSILNEAMKKGGLAFTECERVYLSTGDQFAGLQNKVIDVAVVSEPTVSLAAQRGIARSFATVDTFYPDQQAAVVTFGSEFIAKRRDIGVRFMKAFIRGARAMNDAQKDGHFVGERGDEAIAIIAKYSRVKDVELLKKMTPSACDPDGRPNLAGLEKDLELIQSLGLVGKEIKAKQIVDLSFVDAALAELGPYKRAG